jgi:uncharacterized protein YndB with AHSA1/START domain
MEKTGESYTAARAVLLAAEATEAGGGPPLPTSDAAIREKTGRGWEEWFDLLDEWGATELTHTEIARRVAAELDTESLGWYAQAVTLSYERVRGGREVGQRSDGLFTISVQRTVAVPVERLFDAFVDESERGRWLSGDELSERTATRPKSARFDWAGGETRVHVTFGPKGEESSTLTVEHIRLPDAGEAERTKAFWRERLTALKAQLETGEANA